MTTTKIVITLNTAWNIYNFRRPLIHSLQEAGYRVICFAPADHSTERLSEEGIEIHPLHCLSRKGTNPLQDIRLINELKRAYRKHGVDLAIHFTIKPNIYGSIAAHQTGIPSIAVVTGLGYTFLSSGLSSRAARKLYRYSFRRNQLTIFQNPDDRALFIDLNLVSDVRSTVILGSGIDTERYELASSVPDTNTFVFIGRLLRDKGIKELLEGFALFTENHPDGRLIIIGDPDPDNPASITEKELAIYRKYSSIEFAGFQSDVRPFIRRAGGVILPSYREGVPRTLLEALSMGRPVITTDVPGCREVVVPGENGFMIPSHDAQALSAALKKYGHLDSSTRQKMGRKSREMALNKFSTEVVNERYLEEIRRLLKER